MTKSMKTSAVLTRALKRMGPKGALWRQGDYRVGRGYCLLGAIRVEGRTDSDTSDAANLIRKATRCCGPAHAGLLSDWNDKPGRTFAQVRAAFLKAIALAKKAEAVA